MSNAVTHATSVASAWDRYALVYQNAHVLPTDTVTYAPGVGTEADFRLLGPVAGKRIIDLGCGGGQAAVAMAKQGAVTIGVDISVEQLAFARRVCEEEETRVELRHGDLAELAFQRADSIDVVTAMMSLHYVPDLNRVFRQAHRILKPNGMFLFSLPHPSWTVVNGASTAADTSTITLDVQTVPVVRNYFDKTPLTQQWDQVTFTEYHRPLSEIFMGLIRSSYRVDAIAEGAAQDDSPFPKIIVVRARKEA